MGIADVIPGVSGGTIAFITGIYERLIKSISQFKFKEFRKNDWKFFVPLGLGILTSLYIFSGIVSFLLENYPSLTYSFFIGLILASSFLIKKGTKSFGFEQIVFLIFGLVSAYAISGLTTIYVSHTLPFIFFSGGVAISAMILPGISGAFLLLLLNQYEFLLKSLHEKNLVVIATFGFGAIIGLLSFSRFLSYLLKNFREVTFYFLIGIMLGALRIPLTKVNFDILNLILIIVGFGIVLLVEKISK